MLQFLFLANNEDKIFKDLKEHIKRNSFSDSLDARLTIMPMYNLGNDHQPIEVTGKTWVMLSIQPKHPNTSCLTAAHCHSLLFNKHIGSKVHPNPLTDDQEISIKYCKENKRYHLCYQGGMYASMNFISCIGDWLMQWYEVEDSKEFLDSIITSRINNKRYFNMLKYQPMASVANEIFKALRQMVKTKDTGEFTDSIISGKLMEQLSHFDERSRNLICDYIGFSFHAIRSENRYYNGDTKANILDLLADSLQQIIDNFKN